MGAGGVNLRYGNGGHGKAKKVMGSFVIFIYFLSKALSCGRPLIGSGNPPQRGHKDQSLSLKEVIIWKGERDTASDGLQRGTGAG